MIPGLGGDAAVWRRTIAALGDDCRCIVGDTLQDATLAAMARRILESAPERFALAGVSMGAMAAIEMMKQAPQRVTRLALIGAMARPDPFSRMLIRRVANLVVSAAPNFRRLAESSLATLVDPAAPKEVRAEIVQMYVRVGARVYVRQNNAVISRGDLSAALPGLVVPTMVIVGQNDRMTPVGFAEEIHALLPNSTMHVIANCGHLPPIEKPEITAELLRRLLAA